MDFGNLGQSRSPRTVTSFFFRDRFVSRSWIRDQRDSCLARIPADNPQQSERDGNQFFFPEVGIAIWELSG